MFYEIKDALESYYSDDTETLIDCLRYLSSIDKNNHSKCADIAYDLGYCIDCGSKLVEHEYEEHHTELFGCPTEYILELLCPKCDY